MISKTTHLGDVAEFINGAAFKPEDWGDEGFPIIRIQNLTDSNKPFNRTKREVSKKIHVQPGDLLVSWSATLGIFEWRRNEVALLNQHIFRVVPDEKKVDKSYLKYALAGSLQSMQKHLHGATMLHVNRGEFLATPLFLPPLPEQRRIAAILDQADALRAKRREALAQLDILTQSIFIEMFGGLADIDNNTKIGQLGDYLTFLTSGGRGWAKYYSNTGSRFIRSLDVQMNHIGEEDVVFVEAPSNAEAKRTEVKAGDVLLTITGSLIGRVATAPDSLEGAYISQHVAILRVKRDRLDPYFLSHYLSLASGGQRQIAKAQYGQTKPGLNFEQIRGFRIPIPSLEHQQLFIHRVQAMEIIQASQNTSELELDKLFASLQHRAFRGEL